MYAVIATGGKQYRVAEGDILRIEKLTAAEGEQVVFDQVLMVADGDKVNIGQPYIEGGKVNAKVNAIGRGKKIHIIKFKRRKKYRKQQGHRQDYTEVEITAIAIGKGGSKPAAKAAPEEAEKKAAAPVKTKKETPEKKKATPKTKAKAAPMFLDKPNGDADDLKKISGVGPVLEGKLNDLGIYHFSQIAAFSADDIAMIDDKLNFKGRIERDGWLKQAKELDKG